MARDRKRHACETEAPDTAASGAAVSASASPGSALAPNPGPAHPCLIQLVRLLARQAAQEDIARQRAAARRE